MHFDLVYRAKTVDDANQTVAEKRQDQRHAERWTFGRALARTAVNGGVIAARCPPAAPSCAGLDGTAPTAKPA